MDNKIGINTRRNSKISPLSFAQQRIWFMEQLVPESVQYNICQAFNIKGNINVTALEKAFNKLIMRHDSLRTSFDVIDNKPVQIVSPKGQIKIDIIEANKFGEYDNEAINSVILEDFKKPFDLEESPLIKIKLYKVNDIKYILVLTMHHIISDDISIRIILNEIFMLYYCIIMDYPIAMDDLKAQYIDYVKWQEQWLDSNDFKEHILYWKDKLYDVPVLQLPQDYTRPAVLSTEGETIPFKIDKSLAKSITHMANEQGVTLFMVLLTAYRVLLYKYTYQSDVCIGTPFSERNQLEFEGLIGLFLNTLAIRTNVDDEKDFKTLLLQVKESTLEAYAHGNMPFEKIVEELQPERSLNNNPLFQAMFSFYNHKDVILQGAGLELNGIKINNKTSKFDLTLYMTQKQEIIEGEFEFNVNLFNGETIVRIINHFKNLLNEIVNYPDYPVSKLSILSKQEHFSIINKWNNTNKDYASEDCLHKLFEKQVNKTPDATAVIFNNDILSYRDLNKRINRLAHYLIKNNVGPDVLVGIFMTRSIDLIVVIYAIIKAGGAYVPLEPNNPSARINMMIEDSKVPIIITHSDLLTKLSENSPKSICIDLLDNELSLESEENPTANLNGDNLAYVIYTSGSTGIPKGVMCTHKGICNSLLWMQDEMPINSADRVLQKTPYSFDISLVEFFWPLINGAALVIAKPEGHKDPNYIIDIIKDKKVTTIQFVPSMLEYFLSETSVKECSDLKRVICIGEVLSVNLVKQFYENLNATIYNLYGPTEAAVHVTYYKCSKDKKYKSVPIGRPISNMQIYILDAYLNPVPIGVQGEIYIGGIGVARGYLNRPNLNTQSFIKNPFSKNTNDILYKTGDLARFLDNGNIEFLGRIDNQIKLRGMRIEIKEIEHCILLHPLVCKTIVLCDYDNTKTMQLIAYIKLEKNCEINHNEIKNFLKERLPEYMIPAYFIKINKVPLLINGKIDKKALPKVTNIEIKEPELELPNSKLEKEIVGIWKEVLGRQYVGVNENFFDIGGHSLILINVRIKISQIINREITIVDMFKYTTIKSLAEYFTQNTNDDQNVLKTGRTRAEIRKKANNRALNRRKIGLPTKS